MNHWANWRTLLVSFLPHSSPVIFNILPKKIDLMGCSVTKLKKELDKFLQTLPDESPVHRSTINYTAASNSVLDQLRLVQQDLWNGSSSGSRQLCGRPSKSRQRRLTQTHVLLSDTSKINN